MKNLLLVDDDEKLAASLMEVFHSEGMLATHVSSLNQLNEILVRKIIFKTIILDRMLGDVDTKFKIAELKKMNPIPFILVLSAISTPAERAELIDLGADDYIGKPFHTNELLARLRSLMRREASKSDQTIRELGASQLNINTRRISVGEKFEDLPAKEFMILNLLSEKPGLVQKREDLVEAVWGNRNLAENNLVEATITNLRKRILDLNCGFEIKNKRNIGYWIET